MTEYIDELKNYSLSTFENTVSSFEISSKHKQALNDLHYSLDLPEAIASLVNAAFSNGEMEQSGLKARIWGLIVIELYFHLISMMTETERIAATRFFNLGIGEDRLARMCILIWFHPIEAPKITRALAEAPKKWLHLDDYPNKSGLEMTIVERLMNFTATLEELQVRMSDHIQTLQDKCLYDFCMSA